MENSPWTDRPSRTKHDIAQIRDIVQTDRTKPIREIIVTTGISVNVVYWIIIRDIGSWWLPWLLNDKQKEKRRISVSRAFMDRFIYMNPNQNSNPWYGNTRPHWTTDTLVTVDFLGNEHLEQGFCCLSVANTPVTISLQWVCDGFIGIFDRGPMGLLVAAGSFLGIGRASSYF